MKYIEAVQKGLRRDAEKKRKWKAKDEKSQLIKKKCWPERGLKQLIEILQRYDDFHFLSLIYCRYETKALKIIEKAKGGGIMLSNEYQKVINFLVAHLFVANPQSRVGALNRLNMDQCRQLCRDGRLACQDFKTWETYESQFITACPATVV